MINSINIHAYYGNILCSLYTHARVRDTRTHTISRQYVSHIILRIFYRVDLNLDKFLKNTSYSEICLNRHLQCIADTSLDRCIQVASRIKRYKKVIIKK